MANTQLINGIISYGLERKKSKRDIMAALLKTGQIDFTTALAVGKGLGEFGIDEDQDNTMNLNKGGPPVTAGVAQELGDSKAAEEMINSLSQSIDTGSGKKAFAPIAGQLRAYNPWDTEVQSIQSQINATKQIVGKYLEGGVLRLEDEKKYEKILPKIGDTQEVAREKIEQVKKLIAGKYQSQTETLGKAGFDVSGLANDNEKGNEPLKVFNSTLQHAQQNPNDPRSQKFLEMIRNGEIDPTTGMKVEKVQDQSPTSSMQGVLAEEKEEIPKTNEKEKNNLLSRLWSATAEVVPELAGDLGNRVKNVWNEVWENSKASKDRSIFENVLKGQETQFRAAGQIAGGIGDIAAKAMEFAYKAGVPDEQKEKIKKTAEEFLQTETGQSALQILQSGTEKWKEFEKENPNVAKDLSAAVNIVTAFPLAKGGAMLGKEAKSVAGDIAEIGARTMGKDATEKAGKEVFRAIKPSITVDRNKSKIKAVLDEANTEVVERGFQPKSLKEYVDSLSETRKSVWSDIEQKIGEGKELKVNLRPIASEIEKMATDSNLLRIDKAVASRLKKMSESLLSGGDDISVPDAEALKQFVNSELKGTFGKFNLSNVEQNARKIITQKIGEQLDGLLSKIPGEFQSLKNKYGSLRQIEEDALKRLVVFERQNPQGLVESFSKISGVGNILKGIVSASPTDIVKGVGEIAMGKIQKSANNADRIIKKAFEKMAKRKNEFTPKSKTLNYLKGKPVGLSIEDVSKKGSGAIRTTTKSPLIEEARKYYHGTDVNPETISKQGFKTQTEGIFGKGVYLSDSPEFTKSYGKNTLETTAKVDKVWDFSTPEQNRQWSKWIQEGKAKGESFPQKYASKKVQSQGYDAIQTKEFNARDNKEITNLVVFNEKNVSMYPKSLVDMKREAQKSGMTLYDYMQKNNLLPSKKTIARFQRLTESQPLQGGGKKLKLTANDKINKIAKAVDKADMTTMRQFLDYVNLNEQMPMSVFNKAEELRKLMKIKATASQEQLADIFDQIMEVARKLK